MVPTIPVDRGLFLQLVGWLNAKFFEQLPKHASLFWRIEFCVLRAVSPKQYIAVVPFRNLNEIAKPCLVAFAQGNDGKLNTLTLALIRLDTICVE
jgi:hypothetical protein